MKSGFKWGIGSRCMVGLVPCWIGLGSGGLCVEASARRVRAARCRGASRGTHEDDGCVDVNVAG